MSMRYLNSLFRTSPKRVYAKDQILVYKDSDITELFRIDSGYVGLTELSAKGDRKILIILKPGDVLPLTWSLLDSHSKTDCWYEALSVVELSVADLSRIKDLNEASHKVTKELLQYFVMRTQAMLQRIKLIESVSAESKLAYVISYLMHAISDPISETRYQISMPITQQLLADLAGLTRETVSINIKPLEETGVVIFEKDKTLIDAIALQQFIDAC